MTATVLQTDLPGLRARGKVRDIYDLGERLMIVASDRISAFDVVMHQPIPGKGRILTQMSRFWLDTLPACKPHHLDYIVAQGQCPAGYEAHVAQLAERAMVVQRVAILPVECIVRGYIIGSGWKEYQQQGRISGVQLPTGLKLAQKLPEPIFTPSTKATVGHDELINFDQAVATADAFLKSAPETKGLDGRQVMEQVRQRAIEIYQQAARHAESRGIILADTKFEFGIRDGKLVLADEVLTPDSSRFWPADEYHVGANPPSFDKQFLRDYLEALTWNKQPPPPELPAEIVEKTAARYAQAYKLLVG